MSGDPKDPAELWVLINHIGLYVDTSDKDPSRRNEERNAFLKKRKLDDEYRLRVAGPYVPKAELDRVTAELEIARAVCEAAIVFVDGAGVHETVPSRWTALANSVARWKESRSRG